MHNVRFCVTKVSLVIRFDSNFFYEKAYMYVYTKHNNRFKGAVIPYAYGKYYFS